jgi:hypothetical protein
MIEHIATIIASIPFIAVIFSGGFFCGATWCGYFQGEAKEKW